MSYGMADEYSSGGCTDLLQWVWLKLSSPSPFCPRMDPYAVSKRVIDLLSVELNRELSPKVRQEEV